MNDFAGKTAFITGGASGIGFGMAKALARKGVKLMLADIEAGPLDEAVSTLRGQGIGADAEGIVLDVADGAAVAEAAARTVSRFGGVHIVCNNAGVGGGGVFGEMPRAVWDWVVNVNLHGVFNGISAFVPILKQQGQGGHIVNTASIAGLMGSAGGAYAATKFAVVGLSQVLRDELKPFGIGVSVLCPGFVATRIMDSSRNAGAAGAFMGTIDQAPPEMQARFAAMRQAIATGLDPEAVGGRVIECIERDVFYAITHPSWWPMISAAHAEVKAGFDDALSSPSLEGKGRDEAVFAQALRGTKDDPA